jgi:tetratricopeptide (TPR) repeat protein
VSNLRARTLLSLSALCASLALAPAAYSATPATPAMPPAPAASAPPAASGASATSAPSAAELDAAIAKLADGDAEIRKLAARTLSSTPAEALPLLEVRVLRAPEGGTGPIWLTYDKLRKSLPPGTKEDDFDWAQAAAGAGNTPGARGLALIAAGMRAAERQGGVIGARLLVKLSVEHKGIFKPLATAALKRMGDHAVAALVEVRRDPDKDLRNFANKLLDGMGRFLPQDAVQVKDPQSLADVLVAFGKAKDPDALRVVISYLNADRVAVRDSARWAIAQFGADAKPILKETYEAFSGEKVSDDLPADKLLASLLGAYDKVRLAEVFHLLDEGIAHRDAGRLEEAIASFDALLARAPTFDRRAELAPAYFELGKRTAAKDRTQGRVLMSKAARLATGTPLSASIEAELAFLEAQDLLDHGVADTALLRKVVQLDPNHQGARDLLTRLESEERVRDDRFRRWAGAGAAGLVAALLAVLLVGRGKKAPPPSPRRPVRVA